MSSSSKDDDKSISIHSDSDDSRDNDNRDQDQESSPEEYLTKGRGTTQGKGKKKGTRKPPARKTTSGKYFKLLRTCTNTLHTGTGKCGNRKTKGEDLRGKHG